MAQHYDVAVIGGGVGPLVAALMLARGGRRVLLVDHANANAEAEGEGPIEAPCYALGDMSCIARYHDELGITPPPTMRPAGRSHLQVLLPRHRLTISGGRENLATELRREFPADGASIDDVLQRLSQQDRAICHFLLRAPSLPPNTLLDRLRLWQSARALGHLSAPLRSYDPTSAEHKLTLNNAFTPLPSSHPLQRLFSGCLPLMQDSCGGASTHFAAVHLISQVLMGHSADAPDRAALLQLLWATAKRAGIELRHPSRIKRMGVSHKRATHLELVHERQEVRAQYYLYGHTDPLAELWDGPLGHPDHALRRAEDKLQSRDGGCWLQRQWHVPKAWVPAALAPVAWHVDGRATGREATAQAGGVPDEPFVLQRLDEGDTTRLIVTVPVQQVPDGPGRINVTLTPWAHAVWRRVEPRLRRTLPHLPQNNGGLGPMQVLAERRVAPPETSYLGVSGRSHKTALRNVIYCGRGVVPGLGLEGEYLTAAGAVALLNKQAGWRS